MYTVARCTVGFLTLSVSDARGETEGLHLLQTSSAKVSLHSDKECTRAKKAGRDARKQLKTDKAAFKAARAAMKSAKQAMLASQEVDDAAQAQIASVCPIEVEVPEVDNSPDQGCSTTIVTSKYNGLIDKFGYPAGNLLINGLNTVPWFGFEKVVPGGGVPEGAGGPSGKKIAIATMQPCSVAWTLGWTGMRSKASPSTGKTSNPVDGKWYQSFQEKKGVQTACECREWADTVAKFPAVAALEYSTSQHDQFKSCRVYFMTPIPWQRAGFGLQLWGGTTGYDPSFTCYLGNPDAWKQQLQMEQAKAQIPDKCSKTKLWSYGEAGVSNNPWERKLQWNQTLSHVLVGTLMYPLPPAASEGGRKQCLKWAKADPKCKGAVALELHERGECKCVPAAPCFELSSREIPREVTSDRDSNGLRYQACMF